ncbi:MAG: VOC family protein [Paracoccus sp. (in: a-proteobacteria)]
MASSDAPMTVARLALRVRDLDRVGDFYQRVIGLDRIAGDGEALMLGQGDLPLIELRRDRAAQSEPRGAGLFHTAFLLPSRGDLGRWLEHARTLALPLDGASDHLVSEAVYLHDPEGNGIEVYADRPRETWNSNGHEVQMASAPMDVAGVLAAGGGAGWNGAPSGTVIGHVHLQLGDIPAAEAFYADRLGFDVTARLPQASFFATGGYHHHLAGNTWRSCGARMRDEGAAGLDELFLAVDAQRMAGLGFCDVRDPWGNRITVLPG